MTLMKDDVGYEYEALLNPHPNRVTCVLRDHMGTALCEPTTCTTEQLSDPTWMPSLGPVDRSAPYCEVVMTFANGNAYHIRILGMRQGETI